MRVLLVSGSVPPIQCGVGDYTLKLADALARQRGVAVGLLTTQTSGIALPANVELAGCLPDWCMTRLGRLWRIIRRWRPDVVHFQYPAQRYGRHWLPSLVPLIAWIAGAKVIRTWHEKMSWFALADMRGAAQFLAQAIVPGRFITVRPDFGSMLHPLFRRFPWKRSYDFIASGSTIPASRLSERARAALRAEMLGGQHRLLVFFGFMQSLKGIDLLFEIGNPEIDRLVIAGAYDPDNDYYKAIEALASGPAWSGRASVLGFLPPSETADLLAAADAVVLPLREGAGSWNTSLRAAIEQGTFVVATAAPPRGYDPDHNVYYAQIDDIPEMRAALAKYAGRRSTGMLSSERDRWAGIAARHLSVYAGAPGEVT